MAVAFPRLLPTVLAASRVCAARLKSPVPSVAVLFSCISSPTRSFSDFPVISFALVCVTALTFSRLLSNQQRSEKNIWL